MCGDLVTFTFGRLLLVRTPLRSLSGSSQVRHALVKLHSQELTTSYKRPSTTSSLQQPTTPSSAHRHPRIMGDQPPANALSGPTLSYYMISSLPQNAQKLTHAYECIALAAHASMLAIGFRLVGLGEDHRIQASSDPNQPSPLPNEWNAQSGSYAFRYKHSQSSMEYLIKVNRMGNKVVVMGMGMGGDERTIQFEVKMGEWVSDGNLPFERPEGMSKEDAQKKLIETFVSVGRLSDFGSLMRVQLIQKLVPGLQKEGYEESTQQQTGEGTRAAPGREDERPRYDPLREERDPPARPFPLHDPLAMPPRRPMPDPMPGFEDEFEIQRPPRGMPQGGFPRYGDRDLYPQGLGPNDPLRGGVGPGLGGPMGGGGMHPTFDDPLFAGQGQRGPGFDPQAPPGARYDPPFGPGQGGHPRGAGMGGRPPNPFGGFGDGDFI